MWMLWVLLGVYAGTSALGTSIWLGWVSTRGWRWAHHALYALIWLALAGATWQAFTEHAPWRWGLIGVAPFLVLLPRFRPGSPAHCWTATGGLFIVLSTAIWSLAG